MLLSAEHSQVLIVDVQERLLPVMNAPDQVVRGCSILLESARTLGIPISVSEQYPRGIGPTVEPLAALADRSHIYDKLHFSCAGDAAINERIRSADRNTVIIGGIEAHVCVLQTALDLQASGLQVAVVADATSSRAARNAQFALKRMAAHGVDIVTTEMVVFEWLRVAGTDAFRTLSRLIK
jgi:nicotinamidase-related amidase